VIEAVQPQQVGLGRLIRVKHPLAYSFFIGHTDKEPKTHPGFTSLASPSCDRVKRISISPTS